MIIGNVVVKNGNNLSVPHLKVVSDIKEVDNDYPILLMGYHDLKEKYELDFLNRKLGDDLFWTFTRTEERTMYNKDLYDFVIYCEGKLMEGFIYYYIDPFNIKIKSLKRIISYITNNNTIYYEDNNMLFIHSNGITFGFNLAIGEVIGISRNSLHLKLMNNEIKKLPKNITNKIILEMGDIEFDNAQIPYLSEKINK